MGGGGFCTGRLWGAQLKNFETLPAPEVLSYRTKELSGRMKKLGGGNRLQRCPGEKPSRQKVGSSKESKPLVSRAIFHEGSSAAFNDREGRGGFCLDEGLIWGWETSFCLLMPPAVSRGKGKKKNSGDERENIHNHSLRNGGHISSRSWREENIEKDQVYKIRRISSFT